MDKRFIARLFLLYLGCVVITWSVMIIRYAQGGLISSPNDRSWGVVILLLVMTTVGFALGFMIVAIGRYVYIDSRARGMEPLFWASVAMLVPFFIGLAGYLQARQHHYRVCPACHKEIAGDSLYCNGCGHCLGRAIAREDIQFCRRCGTKIGK